jgi:hypothetical protein
MSARAYFRRKKPVKRLPRDLVTRFDYATATENEILLMKASAAKDRHGVRKLLAHYKATSALQVIPLLPKQKLMSYKEKFLSWLRRLEGSSEHDPMIKEIRSLHTNKSYTIRHGYLETPME